jgi:hypothetical protein
MGSAKTTKHQWPIPAATDPAKMVRRDIVDLAAAIDSQMRKITHSTGAPPTSGVSEGDIHLQYTT